jgi:hypothetical protein
MAFKIMHVHESSKILEKSVKELEDRKCNILCILPITYKQDTLASNYYKGALIVLDQTWIFYEEPSNE